MARVTGFPQAICARYIAEGKINAIGIVLPEDRMLDDLYSELMADLEQRDIHILEEINWETVEKVQI